MVIPVSCCCSFPLHCSREALLDFEDRELQCSYQTGKFFIPVIGLATACLSTSVEASFSARDGGTQHLPLW